MTTFLSPVRVTLFLAFLSVSALTGASCGDTSSGPGGMVGSGPSSGIQVVPGSGGTWSPGSNPPGTYSGPLLTLINSRRQSMGLKALTWHDGMDTVTYIQRQDMVNQGYFSIVNPQGVDVYERLVSSSPRIDFDNAFAMCVQFPSGTLSAATVFQGLISNTATLSVIDNSEVTHFAANFTNAGGIGVIIFAVNTRP